MSFWNGFKKRGTPKDGIYLFGASWNALSSSMRTKLDKTTKEYTYVDTDTDRNLTDSLNIRGIPALVVIKNGKPDTLIGDRTEEQIKSFLAGAK